MGFVRFGQTGLHAVSRGVLHCPEGHPLLQVTLKIDKLLPFKPNPDLQNTMRVSPTYALELSLMSPFIGEITVHCALVQLDTADMFHSPRLLQVIGPPPQYPALELQTMVDVVENVFSSVEYE